MKVVSIQELKRNLSKFLSMELFQLRDLTEDLCMGLTMPLVSTPRSIDLAHLRTALWFHAQAPLRRFVTTDEDQQQAARELS